MEQSGTPSYYKLVEICARLVQISRIIIYKLKGYDVAWSTQMERHLNLERLNPKGIHIGPETIVTSTVSILAHRLIAHEYYDKQGDKHVYFTAKKYDTYIGKGCVIGIGAIIMPGVSVGDFCIIGAGAVVTKDVPNNTIVAGNPAKVARENITHNNLYI